MNEQEQAVVKGAVAEIADDIELVKKLAAEAKDKGWKNAIATHLPEVIAEVKQDIAAAKAVAPIVKAGYQSTEFWLVTVTIVAVAVSNAIGHPLPWQETAILGGVTAVYTFVRGALKKSQ